MATVADDGEQALNFARDHVFDLIIVNIAMPRMSGIEFVAHLRARSNYAQTPVIFVTAKALEIPKEAIAQQLNIAAIFDKPFSPTKLLSAVRRALGQRE